MPTVNTSVLTAQSIKNLLAQVTFHDWTFHVGIMGDPLSRMGSGYFLQVHFDAYDPSTKQHAEQHGRKWYVSRFATPSEVIQTALAAVLMAVEHEARESFLVHGLPIYGPHWPVEQLIQMCDPSVTDQRPPMTDHERAEAFWARRRLWK